jgi:hypothetical protein
LLQALHQAVVATTVSTFMAANMLAPMLTV